MGGQTGTAHAVSTLDADESSRYFGRGLSILPATGRVDGTGAPSYRRPHLTLGFFLLILIAFGAVTFVPNSHAATRTALPALSKLAAVGTGDVTIASSIITNVSATSGTFEEGEYLVATGIPAGTKITSVLSPTELQLSANATATTPAAVLNASQFVGSACGVATDAEGNYYVGSASALDSAASRVKIYAPDGTFLNEYASGEATCSLAVDSFGRVYGTSNVTPGAITRYKPSPPPPITGSTTYALDGELNVTGKLVSSGANAVAVNPANDNAYVTEAPVNEKQTFARPTNAVCAPATEFTLTFEGQTSTTALPCTTASNAQIQAALNSLSTIQGVGGSVVVSGGTASKTVEFGGSLGGKDIPAPAIVVKKREAGEPIISSSAASVDGRRSRISIFQPNGTLVSSTTGSGVAGASYYGVDVFGTSGRVYVTDPAHNKALIFAAGSTTPLIEIDGSGSAACTKGAFAGMVKPAVAVDQANGNVLVSDIAGHGVVDEFNAAGKCINTIESVPAFEEGSPPGDIAVDASSNVTTKGNAYVTSGSLAGKGRLMAFGALAPSKTLTTSFTPGGSGQVKCYSDTNACLPSYAEGSSVELRAVPSVGFALKQWTGGTGSAVSCNGSTSPTCAVELTADSTIQAEFELAGFKLSVTKNGTGAGKVTSTPAGIDCGIECEKVFAEGTLVSLSATADPGSTFKGWGGDCSGSGPCEVTMSAIKDVSATFALAPAVTGLDPSKGPTAGGNEVVITGTSLTGATEVKFGTNSASITENTATQIKVNAPAGSAGAVDVTVTTPDGTSANTTADNYTYVAPPTITNVNPNKGPTAGGNSVTVTGTNLQEATFKFGASDATGVNVTGGTSATMTAPAGAVGTVDVRATTPAGGESVNTPADDYTYALIPTVTNLDPSKGPTAGGNEVVITGTSLTGATEVKFGTNSASITENTATQIKVNAPAHAAGVVAVTVTTSEGTSADTPADDYAYLAPPTITSLDPNKGPIAGGNQVVITGTNLENVKEIKFGTNDAIPFIEEGPTQIKATAPAGSAGAVDVSVITHGGVSTNTSADDYTYVTNPTVTGLNPIRGPTAGGNPVVITGTNFTGAIEVKFGSNNATPFNVDSSTQITATAPTGAAGTVDVIVTTLNGSSPNTTADNYTYVAPPTITNVNPNEGPLGGNSVIVTGTNLQEATFKFGANSATSVVVNGGGTSATMNAPSGVAGTVDVRATTPAGGESVNTTADDYTYVAPPSLTNCTPIKGPVAGGTQVTCTGTNLQAATFKIGANSPPNVVINPGGTSATMTVPAGAVGTVDIRATTVGGESPTNPNAKFTYVAPPTITNVNPNKGPLVGGNSVTVTGANLQEATFKFGANSANSVVVNGGGTSATMNAPSGVAGTVDVRATTPAGGESVNTIADDYTYVAPPTITNVNPNKGPTAGGNSVAVTGTNLQEATFKFGANSANSVVVNGGGTSATMTAPSGAVGTVDVRATTPGGESPNTAADDYTYAVAPTVTGVSPSKGPTAGGTVVTITGTNLGGATEVKFGSAAATGLTLESSTQIKATSPAGSPGTVAVSVVTPAGTSTNTAADDYAYVASHALSVGKGGSGGGSITCNGGPCAATYVDGTKVTLVASPDAGSTFGGWSGACTGTSDCVIVVNEDTAVTATFVANPIDPVPCPAIVPPPPSCPPLPEGTPKVSSNAPVNAGKASLTLACKGAGACQGTLKLTAKIKQGKKKKNVVIGKASYDVAAGQSQTIKVKLNGAAKKELKKHRKLKAKLSGGVTGTVMLKLPGGKK